MTAPKRALTALAVLILPILVSACSQTMDMAGSVKSMVSPTSYQRYGARDRECLMRAMFFESNRSSRDGMIAVGTVVMNRLRSGKHGETICAVVGEKRQFAPGVMTRKMNSKAMPDVEAAADAVLKGERHAKVKNAMFFHTAGLKFPYRNMHYTLVAGGNAFYEKRNRKGDPVVLPPEKAPVQTIMVASAEPQPAKDVAEPATEIAAADSQESMVAMADLPQTMPVLGMNGPSPSRRAVEPVVMAQPLPAPALVAAAPSMDAPAFDASDSPVPGQPELDPVVSFGIDPSDADAIGAMIADQDRPAMGFN